MRESDLPSFVGGSAPAFPPPLPGRDREEGASQIPLQKNTPLPSPPPQGGREPEQHARLTRRHALGAGLTLLALAVASDAEAAGNVAAGRQKALQCQTCHGLDGLSKIPVAPNIAGNPEPYLVKSLNDFRTGVRKNEMMSVVVQQLSDTDVADLAAYYAAIEVTVKLPR